MLGGVHTYKQNIYISSLEEKKLNLHCRKYSRER